MQKLVLAATATLLALTVSAPVRAAVTLEPGIHADAGQAQIEKRKKPRIKGGSGCDDAGDVAEHPSCR